MKQRQVNRTTNGDDRRYGGTDRQKDRLTDGRTDRQTDRETGKQTEICSVLFFHFDLSRISHSRQKSSSIITRRRRRKNAVFCIKLLKTR